MSRCPPPPPLLVQSRTKSKPCYRLTQGTTDHQKVHSVGVFSHSADTAPMITLFIPGTPLKTTHVRSMHDPFQTASGVQNSGPWTRGKHQTETKNPWCTSGGRRVQNSGPWDPWLPMVKNSRLFAQGAHSARCAPYAQATEIPTCGCDSCGMASVSFKKRIQSQSTHPYKSKPSPLVSGGNVGRPLPPSPM